MSEPPVGYVAAVAHRRIGSMIRTGVVEDLDLDGLMLRVRFDDVETLSPWIPWASPAGDTVYAFNPPEVGTRVCVMCPGGDTEAGFVNGQLPRDGSQIPADTSDRVFAIGPLTITVKANGDINISTSGQVTLDASVVTLLCNLGVQGDALATGEVTGNGIELSTHRHFYNDTPGQPVPQLTDPPTALVTT